MAFTVTYAIKEAFFDRAAVERILRTMDKATAKALKQAGAYIRTAARRSMKTRKKASAPGSPPSNHAKKGMAASLRNILYGLENVGQSVVIGPIGFKTQRTRGTISQTRPVPNVHEFGGFVHRVKAIPSRVRVRKPSLLSNAQKAAFVAKIKSGAIVKPVQSYNYIEENRTYPKRPFMKPALDQEKPKFPQLWANTVMA